MAVGVQPLHAPRCLVALNALRRGLPPLRWSSQLTLDALAWAQHMAATGALHDPTARGECYAVGVEDWRSVLVEWMISPSHLAVIQDKLLVRVGVAGWVPLEHHPTRWTWHWVLRMDVAHTPATRLALPLVRA